MWFTTQLPVLPGSPRLATASFSNSSQLQQWWKKSVWYPFSHWQPLQRKGKLKSDHKHNCSFTPQSVTKWPIPTVVTKWGLLVTTGFCNSVELCSFSSLPPTFFPLQYPVFLSTKGTVTCFWTIFFMQKISFFLQLHGSVWIGWDPALE